MSIESPFLNYDYPLPSANNNKEYRPDRHSSPGPHRQGMLCSRRAFAELSSPALPATERSAMQANKRHKRFSGTLVFAPTHKGTRENLVQRQKWKSHSSELAACECEERERVWRAEVRLLHLWAGSRVLRDSSV